jgi:hypothetical protein
MVWAVLNAGQSAALTEMEDLKSDRIVAILGGAILAHITVVAGDFQQVCLTDGPTDPSPLCVTKTQLAALLAGSTGAVGNGGSAGNQSPAAAQPGPGATSSPSGSVTQNAASTTPPTIAINGDNPAIIHAGDTYADLGATITGPQADLNLGIKTFLNGTLVSNIVIDTSSVATDTIDYVATDSAGLTSTSTRTVLIKAANDNQASSTPNAANDNIPPLDATTTTATSSAQ